MSNSGNVSPTTRLRIRATSISILCALFLALVSGCQEQFMATGEGPVVVLEKVVHDFGDVGPTTVHTAKFKFTSVGTAPLVIKGVEVCCGTVTRGVKEGQTYAPGRSGTLEVEYHASTDPGMMERELYLLTNDPANEVIPLTIKAEILRRIAFDPVRLRLFLKRDNAGADTLTLTSLDGRPFAVTDFACTSNAIAADFNPKTEATEVVLPLRADLHKLADNRRGQIRVGLTHPECSEVLVLYDVLPEFTVIPSSLRVFEFKPGQTIRREVTLFGNYQEDYEVESVTSHNGFLTLVEQRSVKGRAGDLMTTSEPDRTIKRCTLVLDFTAPEQGDATAFSDELEIEMVDGQTITVDCRGFYAGG